MSFVVYLLSCADRSLYCGYTNDIATRVTKHNAGKASKYTRSRLPVRLVHKEKFSTQREAMQREAFIKKLSRKKKLELVKGN